VENAVGDRHQHRRRSAVTADIRDNYPPLVLRKREEVVVVAAGTVRRLVIGSQIHRGYSWKFDGQQAALDVTDTFQFLIEGFIGSSQFLLQHQIASGMPNGVALPDEIGNLFVGKCRGFLSHQHHQVERLSLIENRNCQCRTAAQEIFARRFIGSQSKIIEDFRHFSVDQLGKQPAINTPNGRYIDLGTEFGVRVDEKNREEVHVFAGRVNAEIKTSNGDWSAPRPLRQGEAFIFSGKIALVQVAQRTGFPTVNQVEPKPEAVFARWQAFSKELQKRRDLMAYYDFQQDQKNPELLVNKSPAGADLNGKIQGATWVAGRFAGKDALEFKQPKHGVRVVLPRAMTSMTLAVWVNLDGLPYKTNSLLMSDGWKKPSFHWLLAQNGSYAIGVMNKGGYLILGSSPPASPSAISWTYPRENFGRWSMLAIIYQTEAKRIAYFYNGGSLGHDRISNDAPIQFGAASIGPWDTLAGKQPTPERTLDGRMDELMIFDAALPAEEIQKIYEAGKP
jgi:hypothetical protein